MLKGYMTQIAMHSCFWYADSLRRGDTSFVHRIGLGDWWECPVCRYSIMGWPNGVIRTMAVGWTG
jgi:hypothetical protein